MIHRAGGNRAGRLLRPGGGFCGKGHERLTTDASGRCRRMQEPLSSERGIPRPSASWPQQVAVVAEHHRCRPSGLAAALPTPAASIGLAADVGLTLSQPHDLQRAGTATKAAPRRHGLLLQVAPRSPLGRRCLLRSLSPRSVSLKSRSRSTPLRPPAWAQPLPQPGPGAIPAASRSAAVGPAQMAPAQPPAQAGVGGAAGGGQGPGPPPLGCPPHPRASARPGAMGDQGAGGSRPAGLLPGAPPANNHGGQQVLLALGKLQPLSANASGSLARPTEAHERGKAEASLPSASAAAQWRSAGARIEARAKGAPILQRPPGRPATAPAQQQLQLPAQGGCRAPPVPGRDPGPGTTEPRASHRCDLRLGSGFLPPARRKAETRHSGPPGIRRVGSSRTAAGVQEAAAAGGPGRPAAMGIEQEPATGASQKILPLPQSPLESLPELFQAIGGSARRAMALIAEVRGGPDRFFEAGRPAPAGFSAATGISAPGGRWPRSNFSSGPSASCSSHFEPCRRPRVA